MKVLAINGSPRKSGNTATLLNKALEGAALQGAETELIHLYNLDYKSCKSCFACKQKDGKSYGKCAQRDGLTPIMEKAREVDVLIIGSPIYFMAINGEIRSFLERLMYPYLVFGMNPSSLFKRRIATGLIFTMSTSQSQMKEIGISIEHHLKSTEWWMKIIFGRSESLLVTDVNPFNDSSKYNLSFPEVEAKRRREVFHRDCEKAFEMGARLVKAAGEGK